MRRGLVRLAVGGVVGVVAVLAADEAAGQRLFSFGDWGADAELGFDRSEQTTDIGGTPSSRFRTTRYEERIGLENNGFFILAPEVLTGRASGRFGLFQEQDRVDGDGRSRSGTLLGYAADAALFGSTPYGLSLFASRTQDVQTRELGGRSEVTLENRGTIVRLGENSVLKDLGFPYFTSTLGARRETLEEETTSFGQTLRRDETRTVLGYDAAKGFETSDLTLRYEFVDFDDRAGVIGSFQSHTAGLTYSRDFGRRLNRRWDSRLSYYTRSGRSPSTYYALDEELRIDHHEAFFTDYRYLFTRQEVDGDATTTHSATALLSHRLYDNLTTRLRGGAAYEDFAAGDRRSAYGDADLDYRRRIPRGGELFLGAGARYQIDDNRFTTSRIDVLDEPHQAPLPLGAGAGFTLNNPFVVASTIVVVDTTGGVRLPATLGVDYLVVQEGAFTRIIPLASSLVIQGGDLLAVSYTFEVNPSLEFTTLFWRATAGVDFRWIALRLDHRQIDQTPRAGQDGRFLDDRRTETVRLELRGEGERVQALASAQYQVEDGTRLDYTSWQLGQLVSCRPILDLVLSLDAQETFTDYRLPARRSDSYFVRGNVDWYPGRWLVLTAFAGVRILNDSEVPSETIREAGARARSTMGRLDVVPTFTWSARDRGTVETENLRFEVRVVRRFF